MIREGLRSNLQASLVIVDVDHFKSVNDRFGHQHGDDVLKAVASSMQQTLRDNDHVFRYGGEEFVVLLPATAHPDALLIAGRLRLAISEGVHNLAGEPMTISLGVATAPGDGSSFNALLAVADERLYKAKRGGRNRVVGEGG